MVAMRPITTLWTTMRPLTQGLGDSRLTLRTGPRRTLGVDSLEVHPTLETHPLQQGQKCTKGCINTLFAKHSSVESNRIQVFSKYGLPLVTQTMRCLQMEVFTSISNMVMQFGYLDLRFLPVFRTLLFSRSSALEQFQLPMH